MKPKKTKYFFMLVLFTFLLTACAGQSTALESTTWQLVELRGNRPVGNPAPTIIFEGGEVTGDASCNLYGGEYKIKGEKIVFDMMMSTMMACAENDLMLQEQVFLEFLAEVERWELHGGELSLINAAGEALVFKSQY